MDNQKVWFVTGASKGLGKILVQKLLAEGHKVAATSRDLNALTKSINTVSENFLPLQVDLSKPEAIQAAVEQTIQYFKVIDVVVNNAGYGIGGAIEELQEYEIQQNFQINVFVIIHVIQSVMPFLRKQGSGHIINIASIAGFAAATGWAMYAATKSAVVGLTEVLAEDVKEFGIKATVVAPGAFRTEFLSKESLVMAEKVLEEYSAIRVSHQKFQAMDGNQIGNPEKAADALIEIVDSPNPPVRLFLGTDAYNRAKQKMETVNTELEEWKNLTLSTDY